MWKKLNIEDARINMSKVVPYDPELSLLDKKQAYYHNNRLTALRKYETDYAVGYKCFKRRANPNNLVDGELTDYIEINKVLEGGGITHLMDIADSYYAVENTSKDDTSKLPDFVQGVILHGIYIGPAELWAGCEFYMLQGQWQDVYLVTKPNSNYYDLLVLKGNDKKNYENNFNKTTLDVEIGDLAIVKDDFNYFNFFSRAKLEKGISAINKILGKGNHKHEFEKYADVGTDNLNFNIIRLKRYSTNFETERCRYDTLYNYINDGNKKTYHLAMEINFLFFAFSCQLNCVYTSLNEKVWGTDVTGTSLLQMGNSIKSATYDYHFSTSSKFFSDYEYIWCAKNSGGLVSPINLDWDSTTFKAVLNSSFTYVFSETGKNDTTVYGFVNSTQDASAYPFEDYHVSNYVNDSVFTSNGFVVNYTNKLPVTLGHKYKVIARLDTQGAAYLGSDSTYSYVRQNKDVYKISIKKMFPEKNYGDEVNLIDTNKIDSKFCKRVGSYKIFNTTSYWNAIYDDNPDKIVCSCDDWNGRYYSESSTMKDAYLKSTSRVGNFWNSTTDYSLIPNKAISDELTDIMEIENPTYHWANTAYTMHNGTAAYIYTQNTTVGDAPFYQQYKVTKDGFTRDYSESKIFTHNEHNQLVPSILFANVVQSDVVNLLQIGTETYTFLKYSYSPITPSLVYSEIPIAINIDPSAKSIVIQGAFYQVSIKTGIGQITNPYDTGTPEIETYCCDVTGLRYIGYDSQQAYFYSPSTGIIYTFNGANKLNAFIEVDKRIPLVSGVFDDEKVGIGITNIPSMNIVAMGFMDGVLIICNGQSIFIDETVESMAADPDLGAIRINNAYYYFGTNSTITGLIDNAQEVAVDFNLKTCKIGQSRLENQTCQKHRLAIYSDVLDNSHKAEVTVTINGVLGGKPFTETFTKVITQKDLVDNEYQWEFNPKNTKSMYFQTEISMKNADLLEYWMDINDQTEENLVRN